MHSVTTSCMTASCLIASCTSGHLRIFCTEACHRSALGSYIGKGRDKQAMARVDDVIER